jgi:predicted nucleic acid-binding protein
MGKPTLIDTNILVDVLGKRKLFYAASHAVWQAHQNKLLDGYVAAVSLTNLFYIMAKHSDRAAAWRGLNICLDTFAICEVNREILELAAKMPGRDFEDNVQIAAAYAYNLEAIVTRNKSDFLGSAIPVFSPEELLAQINANGE